MSPASLEDIYRLAPAQGGILFHSLLRPGEDAYLRQTVVHLGGSVDSDRLQAAWQRTVDRHTALRTAFAWEGLERPVQVVHRGVELPVARHDWRSLAPGDRQARWRRLLKEDRDRGFDLARPPLMRLALVRMDEDDLRVVWTYHHLILDGWSLPLLLEEASAVYAEPERSLPPAVPYRRFVEWLGARGHGEAEAFWRRALRGFDEPTPLSFTPPEEEPEGEPFGERRRRLPASVVTALTALGRGCGATLGTVLHGAWALLLGRYGGGGDVVFGSVSAGRPGELEGAERMIGVFIGTVPVRVRMSAEEPLDRWLRALQHHLAEVRQHEHVPLVEIQGWSEVPRGTPLFESLVVFENYPVARGGEAGAGAPGEAPPSAPEVRAAEFHATTSYPLTLLAAPEGGALSLKLLHDRRRLAGTAAERQLRDLERVLRGMAEDPGRALARIFEPGPAQRHALLAEWNDTARSYAGPPLLHLRIRQRAATVPDRVALTFRGRSLTYRELVARADAVASRLRELRVGPEDRVAVAMERCLELPIALLGVLQVGAAYVPLEPELPDRRLALLLGGRAVLTQAELAPRLRHLAPAGCRVLEVSREAAPRGSAYPADGGALADSPAYVIYTSGSTGSPKGVVNRHRSIVNRLAWFQETLPLGEGDRVLQKTPCSFDVSVWEFFWPLLAGAELVLAEPGGHRDPAYLATAIRQARITTIHFVPSMLHAFLAEAGARGCTSLQRVIASGEALAPELVRRFHHELAPAGARLYNLYGPTEAAIDVTWTECRDPDPALVTIGRPVANTRMHVVDERLRPVPIGVAGELCIGGVQLARGYLGRPSLTATAFVPDPLGAGFPPGSGLADDRRLYRTGDLARLTADGRIEFLGRLDHQVKIRGVRVEPGEAEAALRALPGVDDAVVVARQDGPAGPRLVAYVAAGDPERVPRDLAARLAETLPHPLVPAAFVVLDALPRTASGKLDRRALPDPEPPKAGGRPPRTPTEEVLAGLWAEVLGIGDVGADSDFFALGGHSLLAIRLVSRVRQLCEVEMPLSTVFEHPTPESLAALVERGRRQGVGGPVPDLVPAPRPDGAPLSFGQQRFWLAHRLHGAGSQNLPVAFHLDGPLRAAALELALSEVARRHESLRTVFRERGGEVVQEVLPWSPVELPRVDLRGLTGGRASAEAQRLASQEAVRPFDLERDRPLRALLLRLPSESHVALFTTPHAVSDAWSLDVLLREVSALYGAYGQGLPSPLREPLLQYADFAVWQRRWLRGAALAEQVEAHRARLAGTPQVLELPLERPPAGSGRRAGRFEITLPAEPSRALRELARREGATPFMALLAILQIALGRRSGQRRFNVGAPVAGRSRIETEEMVGYFADFLVLPADLTADPGYREVLRRVRRQTLAAFAHQDLPFDRLVEAMAPPRRGVHPLFQVLFSLHRAEPAAARVSFPGLRMRPFALRPPGDLRLNLFLDLELSEGPDGYRGALAYAADLLDPAWVQSLTEDLPRLVEAAVAEPDAPVLELPLEDRRAALVGFTDELEEA